MITNVGADTFSINSGGNNNVIMNPSKLVEGFFFGEIPTANVTGPGEGIGVLIPFDDLEFSYDKGFLCNKTYIFIQEEFVDGNYTEEQYETFKNELVIDMGVGIDDFVLRALVENFDANCPEFIEEEKPPIFPVEKAKYLFLFIIGGITLFLIIFLIKKKELAGLLVASKKKRKKEIELDVNISDILKS